MAEAVRLESSIGSGGPFAGLQRILHDFEERGGNVDDVGPVVAEDMVSRVLERFELQSGHQQGPWEPLSPITLMMRRAEGKGAKMLQDTGILKGSVMPWSEGGEAEAYTNDPKAKFHFSHEPRNKIPLRDAFDIAMDEVAQYAGELMLDGILE